MKTVAIAGVGLIGASFGLALREAGFAGDIIGVSSREALAAGLEKGAITHTASLAEAAAEADLIYLAQPVDRILATIEQLEEVAKPGALVTDAGSTKQAIVEKAAACLRSVHFLGGHPMAGKEQRGARAADAGLFRGRPYVLTPRTAATEASNTFRIWLERIGAQVIEMRADEHDRTVALTSHLPQLLSTALAATLARQNESRIHQIFGPGLLDMTRLAMSSSDLWIPILRTNREAVEGALRAYRTVLTDLQRAYENDTLVELFEAGSAWAKQLRELRSEAPAESDTPRKPGT